jgi:hypothetical protein
MCRLRQSTIFHRISVLCNARYARAHMHTRVRVHRCMAGRRVDPGLLEQRLCEPTTVWLVAISRCVCAAGGARTHRTGPVALWRYAFVQDITPVELGMCLLLMVTFASTIGATLFFFAQLFFVAKVGSCVINQVTLHRVPLCMRSLNGLN